MGLVVYFKPHEFACKCGCGAGLSQMEKALLWRLNYARKLAGIPFVITSALRCELHNRRVGGSKTSSHLYGFAVDIRTKNKFVQQRILKALKAAGFLRIGVAKKFIHVDVDYNKPPANWKYS